MLTKQAAPNKQCVSLFTREWIEMWISLHAVLCLRLPLYEGVD